MTVKKASIYSAQQYLEDNRIENFQTELAKIFDESGTVIADGLVLQGKYLLKKRQYQKASAAIDSALAIIDNHPWALYYQILARSGQSLEKGKIPQEDQGIHRSLLAAASWFNEPAYHAGITLLKEDPSMLTSDRLDELERAGSSSCCELKVDPIFNWDSSELKHKIIDDINHILKTLAANPLAPLSVSELAFLYQIYFYVCKFFSLIYEDFYIERNFSHDIMIALYNKLLFCIKPKTGKSKKELILELKSITRTIDYPNFWYDVSIAESLPEEASDALWEWLKKHSIRINCNRTEQGLYVGNCRGNLEYYSLDRIDSYPGLKDCSCLKQASGRIRLVIFEHFFGALEIWDLASS